MTVHYNFREQKTTEAASLLLQMNGGRMPFLLLLKLLYIADRTALTEWERPITYDNYVSMDKGPVLSTTYDLIKGFFPNSSWHEYIARKGIEVYLKGEFPHIRKLSRAEFDLLNWVYLTYGKIDRFDLSEFTHTFPEYKDPMGSSLPITLEDIFIGLGYKSSDITRVEAEIQEETDIVATFGG